VYFVVYFCRDFLYYFSRSNYEAIVLRVYCIILHRHNSTRTENFLFNYKPDQVTEVKDQTFYETR